MSQFEFYNQGWLDATTGASTTAPFTINGPIDDVLHTDDRILFAGSFTQFNATSQAALAVVDGTTYALVPGQVTITGGGVDDLEVGDGVIYLSGSFTSINGQPRAGLAAIDATTLALLPWAPQVNGAVRAFTFAEGELHVRGAFTTVNGQARNGAAALDVNGALLAWAPALGSLGTGSDVFVRQGDRVLMALPPQSVATPGIKRVLGLDANSGELTGWQVQVAGGAVEDLVLDDDHLFLAGSFQGLQGQPRALVGRVSLNNAMLDTWDAQIAGSRVWRVEPAGDRLFVAGDFSAIGGQPRSKLGTVSRASAQPLELNLTLIQETSGIPATIQDMRAVGDTLYLVGKFRSVNGATRFGTASVQISSGAVLVHPVYVFSSIEAVGTTCLEIAGDTMFLGGGFRSVVAMENNTLVGSDRYHLIAVNRHTGEMFDSLSMTYGIPQRIRANGGRLFVLGNVSWHSGEPRSGVAALNMDDGSLTPFQVDVQGEVHAMALEAGSLFLGGPFTAVNGVSTLGVARVDASTGALQPFAQPIAWGGQRFAFEVHQGRLFLGTTNGMAVYDAVSGVVVPWSQQPNGAVRAMDLHAGRLYIGGSFTQVASMARNGGAAVDLAGEMLLPWATAGAITCLSASSEGIAVVVLNGGMFAVDPELGQPLPIVRPGNDVQLPSAAVVAAEGDLLIMASGNTLDVTDAYMSYLESYHLPTGGRIGYADPYPNWTQAQSDYDLSEFTFVARMLLGVERVYVGGAFMTIDAERRHNLAVFSRPIQPLVQLDLRASLGGVPQQNGLLNDALRAQNLLPRQEPYTGLGIPQHLFGGGEEADVPVFAVADSTAVVDWVMVELRAANDPAEVLATRNGLLRRDGRVVDVDGRSALTFPLIAGAYHVVLQHRNHLGAMTAAPVGLSSVITTVDLRVDPGYGTEGQQSVAGTNALWPGDATGDGLVKYAGAGNDRDAVLLRLGGASPTSIIGGVYDVHDINLDGTIRYTGANNDRDIILQTIGGAVPTAVRVGQVP